MRRIRYIPKKEDIVNLFDNLTLSSSKNRIGLNANTQNLNFIYENSYEKSNKNYYS